MFRGWLTRLATAVFIKALYSLVIAVAVAVAGALGQATGGLGFLFAFGLQAVFYWAIFLYRRQITQRLVAATTGGRSFDDRPVGRLARYGGDVAAQPFGALAGLPRRGREALRQESALTSAPKPATRGRRDDPPEPPEPDSPDDDGRPPGSPSGPTRAGCLSGSTPSSSPRPHPCRSTAARRASLSGPIEAPRSSGSLIALVLSGPTSPMTTWLSVRATRT